MGALYTVGMETDDFPTRILSEEEFPPLLREIADPPQMLYARGTLAPEAHKVLAVVGSREYTTYGKQAVETLIQGLKGAPITIVSGLAIGIDSIAHQAALRAKLHTVAVPGSGISDQALYPRRNRGLAEDILRAGGGLMGELAPEAPATQWTFPARNRIMAGMAHAVLIVEAAEKSGTLITARLAVEYNRDVLAIPGNIFSKTSYGPHMLIRDGATPIMSATDILYALGLKPVDTPAIPPYQNDIPNGYAILALLDAPREKDELIRISGLPSNEANIVLSLLELQGAIREDNGVVTRLVAMQ